MAEPFKDLFNVEMIQAMSSLFEGLDGFDRLEFERRAKTGLDALEMMERAGQITAAMQASFPMQNAEILLSLVKLLHPEIPDEVNGTGPDENGLRGWALVPVGNFVAETCINEPDRALDFLAEMTKRFSSEFAVRPFFRDHAEVAMNKAMQWSQDASHHVRRLASEGSRPRLPWGIRLQEFVKDPSPLIPLLETLKDDPSEYVRRSVANNLNDIAKDHPAVVNQIARDWMQNASRDRQKLVKHACRSLIKAGNSDSLEIFGYGAADAVSAQMKISPDPLTLGDVLNIEVAFDHQGTSPLPVLVDLILRFRKANGRMSPKVFKWTETVLVAQQRRTLRKTLPIRAVTTRRHYEGAHSVAVQVNGRSLVEKGFDLLVP